MLTTALGLQVSQRELLPARQPLSALPSQIDDWTSKENPLDQDTREILGHGEFLWRIYSDAGEQQPDIDLFVAYYPTQKFGDTPHTPLHCLVGAGFIPIVREVVELKGPHGLFPVNRWIAAHGDQRNLVLYWFQAHGRQTTSEYSAKYYLIRDAIRLHRSDGALIRLITPMYKDESPDSAQERMMQVGTHFLSPLDQSIPP
jgi:EpsI family protein